MKISVLTTMALALFSQAAAFELMLFEKPNLRGLQITFAKKVEAKEKTQYFCGPIKFMHYKYKKLEVILRLEGYADQVPHLQDRHRWK
jgi:hypothetical protein